MNDFDLITYMINSEYFWLLYTIGISCFFQFLSARFDHKILLSPIFWSIAVISISLYFGDVDYDVYLEQNKVLLFFLSLTIVSFAIPLYVNRHQIFENWQAILITLLVANICSFLPTIVYSIFFGTDTNILIPLLGKFSTSPINMAISEILNANIPLAAVFSILTGLIITIIGPLIIKIIKITDEENRGFAFGVSGHGVAISQLVSHGEIVISFAALGLILNGILTALMMPIIFKIFY